MPAPLQQLDIFASRLFPFWLQFEPRVWAYDTTDRFWQHGHKTTN
jgi:hypothetical protein